MEVRSAGESGVPREGNAIPGMHMVADFYAAAAFLEVSVIGHGAIGVLDQNVIGAIDVFAVTAAGVRIVLYFGDHAVARGMNGRSGGHFPVNRVLVGAGVAVSSVVALGDFEGRARFVGKAID